MSVWEQFVLGYLSQRNKYPLKKREDSKMTIPEKKSKNGKAKDEKQKEKKNEGNVAIGCCAVVFIVLIVVIIWAIRSNTSKESSNSNKPVQIGTQKNETPSSQSTNQTNSSNRYTPGRETTLKDMGLLFMGTSEENWNKLLKYIQANDNMGVAQMLSDGEALEVDGGSKIKVIEVNVHWTTGAIDHIRVLGGKNALREGWISDTFVQ